MATSPTAPKIDVAAPKFLTAGTVLAIYVSGLLLGVLVLGGSVLVLSLYPLSIWSVLVPVLAAIAFITLPPLGFEQFVVMRLVRSLPPAPASAQASFIAQLSLKPRLRPGLRGLLDDADDIGRLSLTESELIFHGDSVRLAVPLARIAGVRTHNVGLRRFFVYGPRVEVVVVGMPGYTALEFAGRSPQFVAGSRKAARQLRKRLVAAVQSATQPQA
jgi:hypothetical protein